MLLSQMEKKHKEASGKDLGFEIKSKKTGVLMKVIGKSPAGNYIVVKLSGKNKGAESFVEDTERYEFVEEASAKTAKRKTEIKLKVKELGTLITNTEKEIADLESELETLEAAE